MCSSIASMSSCTETCRPDSASRATGREEHDQRERRLGVRAPAFAELADDPTANASRVGVGGPGPDDAGLGETDRQQPGMHAEHADAVPAGFAREVLRELDDRRLRHRVARHRRPPVHSGLAGEVDDPTAAAGDHVGQDELRADEDATHVDFHRAPPGVELDLPHRADRPDDSGVVDEESTGPSSRRSSATAREKARSSLTSAVAAAATPPTASTQRHGCRQLVRGAGDDPDRRAGRGQALRDHAADASPAAGDERDRAGELRRGTDGHRLVAQLAGTGRIGGFM